MRPLSSSLIMLLSIMASSSLLSAANGSSGPSQTGFLGIEPKLNNNILRYGYFCGPGPDDSVWGHIEPFDDIDEACQQHDMAYRQCLEDLSKDLGFEVPKAVHQIMPIRGFAPAVVIQQLFKVAPKYMTCMHHADKDLIENFEYFLLEENLPHWWSKPHAAPKGVPGTEGYKEACALGVSGYCVLSSRMLFKLALGLFRSGVELDRQVHQLLHNTITTASSTASFSSPDIFPTTPSAPQESPQESSSAVSPPWSSLSVSNYSFINTTSFVTITANTTTASTSSTSLSFFF